MQACAGYAIALLKVSSSETVATLLSNLSHVCLQIRESHNAIAFASAACRVNPRSPALAKKVFFRMGRGLHQLHEPSLFWQLLDSAKSTCPSEVTTLAKMMQAQLGYRTRLYTDGRGQVFLTGTVSYRDALPEVVAEGVEVVQVPGKGRGLVSRRPVQHCELVTVSYALAAAVVEDGSKVLVVDGKSMSDGSSATVQAMLAHAAARNNEVSWTLSQLSDGQGRLKPELRLQDLYGLSCRCLPMLGQHQQYYPKQDRVLLPAAVIDSTVRINAHGSSHQQQSGIFPTACLFNHARDSNCTYVSVALEDGSEVHDMLAVMTSRDVQPGEELTVTYKNPMPENNVWGIREA